MKITKIIATKTQIQLYVDGATDGKICADAYLPLICGDKKQKHIGELICTTLDVRENCIVFPRHYNGRDLLTCRFEVNIDDSKADGVCYVTDFSDDFSLDSSPAPVIKKPIGTWVDAEESDYDYLGFGCMMTEINSAWIQKLTPDDDAIIHEYNGKKFYFDRHFMSLYDKLMQPCIKKNTPCLIRLINRPSYRLRGSDNGLMKILLHPAYEQTDFSEQMSAFNTRTKDGFEMYCAFVDFICARYIDRSSPLCCANILDIGNEVNAPKTWHNCGPMSCADFMEEYAVQIRTAHLISRKYYAHSRTNISNRRCETVVFKAFGNIFVYIFFLLSKINHFVHSSISSCFFTAYINNSRALSCLPVRYK